jgi:alpha-1,3-rhamnosyl/mannosyltransferase
VRVGVDVSPLVQTRAGTARHVRGLLAALRGRPGLELVLWSYGGPGRASSVLRDAVWYPHGLGRRAERLDVLHCTTFRGPARARVPTVVTVHDLAILRFPEAFPPWHRLYGRTGLRRVLAGADAIVAVSEFTKGEVVDLAGVPAGRVRVVPNGVDSVFRPDAAPRDLGRGGPGDTASRGRYVLAVATLEPRKNLERAVEAAALAGRELRVVGARGWGGVEVEGWVGEVPDTELAALYRGASCVLYPSLYEGFGLPVLEAMACGTPVVTSRGTAMEEVAGGAAVLVDPSDPAAIAEGIEEAERRSAELVRLGLERASGFTWGASADAVEGLWRELA